MGRPSKQDYRYHDDGTVALYRRPNSAMWYARCKLEDGTALNPFSTGAEDEAEAVKAARKRIMFAQVDQERGLDPGGKTFAFIAEQWLKMMRKEVEKKISTKAKVDSYEAITRRYHIPYFNKTKITEITPKSLAAYETWRAEYWTSGPGAVAEFETITRKDGKTYKRKTKRVARGKMDAEDTVLRQIFKFAVKEEYLPVARMPTIGGKKQVGNGTQSTRRPAFIKEQAGKLLDYDANAFYPITAKALITEEPDLEELFNEAVNEISSQVEDEDFDADYGFQSEWDDDDDDESDELDKEMLELEATKLLFDSISEYPGHEENIERFCLPIFAKAGSEYATKHVMDAFKKRPAMSQIYASYLSKSLNDGVVQNFLFDLASDTSIADWQKMWVLADLIQVAPVDEAPVKAALNLLKDATRHDALRAVAAVYVGRYGDIVRRKALISIYPSVSSYIQAAIYFVSRTWPGVERSNAKASWGGHGPLNQLLTLAMSKK